MGGLVSNGLVCIVVNQFVGFGYGRLLCLVICVIDNRFIYIELVCSVWIVIVIVNVICLLFFLVSVQRCCVICIFDMFSILVWLKVCIILEVLMVKLMLVSFMIVVFFG